MAYAENGFNQMSQRLHHFIREHIVRGTWQKKELPILLNSWEASILTSVRRSYRSWQRSKRSWHRIICNG